MYSKLLLENLFCLLEYTRVFKQLSIIKPVQCIQVFNTLKSTRKCQYRFAWLIFNCRWFGLFEGLDTRTCSKSGTRPSTLDTRQPEAGNITTITIRVSTNHTSLCVILTLYENFHHGFYGASLVCGLDLVVTFVVDGDVLDSQGHGGLVVLCDEPGLVWQRLIILEGNTEISFWLIIITTE